MLVKAVLLFLLAMLLIGFIGKALFPGAAPRLASRCRRCGRPRIGRGPCTCEGRGKS